MSKEEELKEQEDKLALSRLLQAFGGITAQSPQTAQANEMVSGMVSGALMRNAEEQAKAAKEGNLLEDIGKMALQTAGTVGGTVLGGPIGGAAGSALGSAAGEAAFGGSGEDILKAGVSGAISGGAGTAIGTGADKLAGMLGKGAADTATKTATNAATDLAASGVPYDWAAGAGDALADTKYAGALDPAVSGAATKAASGVADSSTAKALGGAGFEAVQPVSTIVGANPAQQVPSGALAAGGANGVTPEIIKSAFGSPTNPETGQVVQSAAKSAPAVAPTIDQAAANLASTPTTAASQSFREQYPELYDRAAKAAFGEDYTNNRVYNALVNPGEGFIERNTAYFVPTNEGVKGLNYQQAIGTNLANPTGRGAGTMQTPGPWRTGYNYGTTGGIPGAIGNAGNYNTPSASPKVPNEWYGNSAFGNNPTTTTPTSPDTTQPPPGRLQKFISAFGNDFGKGLEDLYNEYSKRREEGGTQLPFYGA